jgi:hypothetical protein
MLVADGLADLMDHLSDDDDLRGDVRDLRAAAGLETTS